MLTVEGNKNLQSGIKFSVNLLVLSVTKGFLLCGAAVKCPLTVLESPYCRGTF